MESRRPRKRTHAALLIGINYIGQGGELKGCHEDVRTWKRLLTERLGYADADIVVLWDDPQTAKSELPTHANIVRAVNGLCSSGAPTLFLAYSGHGTRVRDTGADEGDYLDEALCPLDYDTAGFVTDDELSDMMMPLPYGASLTCVFDCCHSGSCLDLPYLYKAGVKEVCERDVRNVLGTRADVVLVSGCRDAQTSADAWIDGKGQGALTATLAATLEACGYTVSFYSLMRELRRRLADGGYDQVPQLSSSFLLSREMKFCENLAAPKAHVLVGGPRVRFCESE